MGHAEQVGGRAFRCFAAFGWVRFLRTIVSKNRSSTERVMRRLEALRAPRRSCRSFREDAILMRSPRAHAKSRTIFYVRFKSSTGRPGLGPIRTFATWLRPSLKVPDLRCPKLEGRPRVLRREPTARHSVTNRSGTRPCEPQGGRRSLTTTESPWPRTSPMRSGKCRAPGGQPAAIASSRRIGRALTRICAVQPVLGASPATSLSNHSRARLARWSPQALHRYKGG